MASQFYQLLNSLGYHHPVHPVLTHLPVGLTIAAFIFIVLASILKSDKYMRTCRHCTVLAALAVIPTALAGYMDWRHFYGGADLVPIKIKMVLAGVLIVVLLAAAAKGRNGSRIGGPKLLIHLLALLVVAGLGYYGGELVYGSKTMPPGDGSAAHETTQAGELRAGENIFMQKCAACHYADRTDTKVGPGLKGLFQKKTMTVSGWPMTEDNVLRQLKTPYDKMPPFDNLTEDDVQALLDYLQTL